MEYEIYQVVPGDTLGEIARRSDTDAETLAGVNGIDDPNKIYIGQQLKIPVDLYPDDEDFYNEQWICFVDPLGKPICNMKTRVVTASGEYRFKTDENGFIPPVRTQNKDDKPKIFVAKVQGGEKQVGTLTAPPGVHQQTIRSPKHKITLPMRRHEGTPDHDPAQPVKLDPGQVQHNRDQDGHPVANVGAECPNTDNLRLGPNNKYRAYILEAANRSGLIPQAIAAFANAEALKIMKSVKIEYKEKGGTTKTKMKRINTGEWDASSAAGGSSGVGITQFLAGTWNAVAKDKNSLLYEKVSEMNAGGKHVSQSELLALRTDPELSIVSAGDYARGNLAALKARGFKLQTLQPSELVKAAYFCHHEGAGGAAEILNGTLSDVGPEKKLAMQLKKKGSTGVPEANAYMEKVGLRGLNAYKKWLFDYIDLKVVPLFFACDPNKIVAPRNMSEIASSLI